MNITSIEGGHFYGPWILSRVMEKIIIKIRTSLNISFWHKGWSNCKYHFQGQENDTFSNAFCYFLHGKSRIKNHCKLWDETLKIYKNCQNHGFLIFKKKQFEPLENLQQKQVFQTVNNLIFASSLFTDFFLSTKWIVY